MMTKTANFRVRVYNFVICFGDDALNICFVQPSTLQASGLRKNLVVEESPRCLLDREIYEVEPPVAAPHQHRFERTSSDTAL